MTPKIKTAIIPELPVFVEPKHGDEYRFIKATDTGKAIRQALKQAFPNTKFRVYLEDSGWSKSIEIEWTDGPARLLVQKITSPFEGVYFDSSDDSTHYRYSIWNGQMVKFTHHHYMNRNFTMSYLEQAVAKYKTLNSDCPPIQIGGSEASAYLVVHNLDCRIVEGINQLTYQTTSDSCIHPF